MSATSTKAAARAGGETGRLVLRCAVAGLILQTPFLVAFAGVSGLVNLLPAHKTPILEKYGVWMAAVALTILFAAGAAWWGSAVAQIAGAPEPRRHALASAVAFGPTVVVFIVLLSIAERYFVEGSGARLPVHVVFAILFTLSLAIVGGLLGAAHGVALRAGRLATRLALSTALVAGGTFLVADVIQDALGRRVGGPNAALTFTMVSVMFVGNIFASLAASAWLGHALIQYRNGGH